MAKEEVKDRIRCFVCIELDEPLKDEIWKLIKKLSALAPNLKWAREEALHLTLKFCGNLPKATVEIMIQRLQESIKPVSYTHLVWDALKIKLTVKTLPE